MKPKSLFLILIVILVWFASCNEKGSSLFSSYSFSFETGMEEWMANSADAGNPPADWSIDCSADIASDGNSAVRLYLNNAGGTGKIWISKAFNIEPDFAYRAHIEYDFASADWDNTNLWTIITDAIAGEPAGIEFASHGDTNNYAGPSEGFVWSHKSYNITVNTGYMEKLYVIIGVCGIQESARTYYLDNISISLTKGS